MKFSRTNASIYAFLKFLFSLRFCSKQNDTCVEATAQACPWVHTVNASHDGASNYGDGFDLSYPRIMLQHGIKAGIVDTPETGEGKGVGIFLDSLSSPSDCAAASLNSSSPPCEAVASSSDDIS